MTYCDRYFATAIQAALADQMRVSAQVLKLRRVPIDWRSGDTPEYANRTRKGSRYNRPSHSTSADRWSRETAANAGGNPRSPAVSALLSPRVAKPRG